MGLVALVPLAALAADFRGGEDSLRVTDEAINENLYVGAGDVAVSSTVHGDAFIGGGQVSVTGHIDDDLFIGGGNVTVAGPVGGDVRIGGGNIRIEGDVAGELMVGGGNVEIAQDSSIAGPVYVGAGQLTIAGTTGAVLAGADTVQLTSTARINGDLQYASANQARIDSGAIISGETKHRLPPQSAASRKTTTAALVSGGVLWLLVSVIMLLLYVYVFPNKAQIVSTDWKNNFWVNLLVGFMFLVVTPIAGVVLLVSIIGIPLGIGIFLLYPIALYIGKLAGVVAAGTWLRSLLDKQAGAKVDWISALVGFIILTLVGVVPVLGGLVVFIVFLSGLGALLQYDWGVFQGLRSQKKL